MDAPGLGVAKHDRSLLLVGVVVLRHGALGTPRGSVSRPSRSTPPAHSPPVTQRLIEYRSTPSTRRASDPRVHG